MSVDPLDTIEQVKEGKRDRLNTWVAITIALLATFSGICKVKDDNMVQAMQQAQADKLDHWAWYQSLHSREEVMNDNITLLTLQKANADAAHQNAYEQAIVQAQEKLNHTIEHKEKLSEQAKADQQTYDKLNYHDDQFDLSDAMMALAISMLAITALVQKWGLYIFALLPASIGTLMGLAGLLGWKIHSDWIAGLLS
jgi:hypothetical protein